MYITYFNTDTDFENKQDFVHYHQANSLFKAQVPLQQNSVDCGVFTIHYALQFVEGLEEWLMSNELMMEKIQSKFQGITQNYINSTGRDTILELMINYKEEKERKVEEEEREKIKKRTDSAVVNLFNAEDTATNINNI